MKIKGKKRLVTKRQVQSEVLQNGNDGLTEEPKNYDSSLHNLNFICNIELAPATCEMFPKLYLTSLCIHWIPYISRF